jgi:hypothetical protein
MTVSSFMVYLFFLEIGDSFTARIRRPYITPSPTFRYSFLGGGGADKALSKP